MSLLDRVNKVTGFQSFNDNSFPSATPSGNSLLQKVQVARGDIKPTALHDSSFPSVAPLPKPDNRNIFQKVADFLPQTVKDIGNIIKDPFNKSAQPNNIIKDLMNTPIEAYHNIEQNVGTIRTDLHTPNTPISKTVGDFLKTLAAQGNFVVSPISALFNAGNDVPVAGTLTKIITTPFTAIGEATPHATNKLIDAIPNNVLSQRDKDNIKPGIAEITSLAAQLIAGHAMDAGGGKLAEKPFSIAKEKVTQLVDRFGHEDARTIQKQAINLAKERMATQEATPVHPAITSFEGNIAEYKRFGGFTEGTHAPDASLRDMAGAINKPEIVQHTQAKVQNAITTGEIKPNPDGTITLYRGGRVSPKNDLVSYSYKKDVAQGFVDEAQRQGKTIPLTEVKVKPEDIKAFIGKAEAEVLLHKDAVVVPVNKERAATYDPLAEKQGEPKQLPAPPENTQLSLPAPKENYITGAGFEMTDKADPRKTEMMNAINTYRKRVENFNKNPTPDRLRLVKNARQSMKRLEGKGLVKETKEQVINTKAEQAVGTSGRGIKTKADGQEAANIKKTLKDKNVAYDKFESLQSLRDKLKAVNEPQKADATAPTPTEGAPIGESKQVSVPRDQLPVGQGEEKYSRLEERVAESLGSLSEEAKQKLGLTTYNEMNKKEQIADAVKFAVDNPEEALAVLRGEKPAPKGLLINSLYVAMHNMAKNDIDLARKLTTLAATRAGQEISILTELDKNSPVSIANDIYKFKEKQFTTKHAGKSVAKVKSDIVKRAKVKPPTLNDWKSLIDQIAC